MLNNAAAAQTKKKEEKTQPIFIQSYDPINLLKENCHLLADFTIITKATVLFLGLGVMLNRITPNNLINEI